MMPLYQRIFLGMFLGFATGALGHFLAPTWPFLEPFFGQLLAPAGQIFLHLIFMMVLPLVVCTMTLSSYRLSLRHDISSLVQRAMGGALIMASAACIIAFIVSHLIPSVTLSPDEQSKLLQLAGPASTPQSASQPFWQQLVVKNPLHAMSQAFMGGSIAPVMLFAWILGFSLARSHSSKTERLLEMLEALQEACFAWIHFLMEKAAPWAVACLIACSVHTLGLSLLRLLAGYVIGVMGALALQICVVYGLILRYGARTSVVTFYRKIRTAMLTAFSTSSSSATLPVSLATAKEELGLDPDASRLILTFGATSNQNGSALYEGITLLFLPHLFGVNLCFADQIQVLALCLAASFGTAGVPGSTLPVMASLLQSLGVPASSLLLVLGVDRLLDMARTTVNVTGDLVLAQWLDRKRRAQP